MKKLSYLLCLMALMACSQQKKETKAAAAVTLMQPLLSTKEIALNGMDFKKADEMVRRYIKSDLSSHPVTSFWFNEDFLDALNMTLENEGADGVRIYFAKDSINRNAIVMVSTKENGLTSKKEPSHKDYFSHRTSLLSAEYAKATPSYIPVKGAELHTMGKYPQTCASRYPHYLEPEIAARWTQNFNRDQQGTTRINIHTSSVWYPSSLFTEIKYYLIQAKEEGKNPDGFRIYVVRKDDKTVSFVLVPTLADANDTSIHHDYYDCLNTTKFLNKLKLDRPPVDNGKECQPYCEDDPTWGLPDSTKTNSTKKRN